MATTDTTEKPQDPNNTIVILDTPLKRGDSTVDSITLRKPMSGELRGVTLVDLVQMDVLALRKVLPRISIPSLTDHEIGTMDPADLMACGIAVSGFLLQKSAKEAVLAA
ncbi:phage tail assembly protein [Pseudomonas sp. 09C 129]|uniref:phage tail assembly protein n=1 Tax=Pseudomonas sp. 09C 129 TaxID=2054915 RepID=UPI000C6E535F|nr:phage tail assembly protein [Pseudomonas sp. 09C 129]AUF99792.1 phage tail assembly protein [Pseudomonas sp. 09C 129]